MGNRIQNCNMKRNEAKKELFSKSLTRSRVQPCMHTIQSKNPVNTRERMRWAEYRKGDNLSQYNSHELDMTRANKAITAERP